MNRLAVMVVVLLAMLLSASSAVLAQEKPAFKLGFKALADQIPAVVGEPLEVEHYGPNGDSLQRTSTGLMVWRKADNWTAFTNGARTWINGPTGVQERGNDERFDFEAAAPVATATPLPLPPVQHGPEQIVAPTAAPTAAPAAPSRASLVFNIDRPGNGDKIFGETSTISGWVVDPAAEGQPYNGIDEFQVYADGPKDGGGKRLDVVSTERLTRADVAQAMSKQAYANSGFRLSVRWTGVGQGPHALHVYAHSSKSGWDFKVINVTLRPGLEAINIQDSDLPPGYQMTEAGWDSGSYYRFYETNLGNGPAIVFSEIGVFTNAATARAAVERYAAGAKTVPLQVLHSSVSKGFELAAPTRAGSPWVGLKEVAYAVDNVAGVAWVGGNANMSLVSQSAGIADRIACRIVGAPVPAGPGFQMIQK